MRLSILFSVAIIVCAVSGYGNETQDAPSLKSDERLAGNKAVVRRQHEDVWSKGDLAAIDQVYTDDFVCHFIVGPEEWKGRDGVRKVVTEHRAAFPDWTETIEDFIVDGDKVVTRFTSTGTHKGAFAGISPTGKKVKDPGGCHLSSQGRQDRRAMGISRRLGFAPADRGGSAGQAEKAMTWGCVRLNLDRCRTIEARKTTF
jgi:steroid delta-isomerase-like uncharacterized protein